MINRYSSNKKLYKNPKLVSCHSKVSLQINMPAPFWQPNLARSFKGNTALVSGRNPLTRFPVLESDQHKPRTILQECCGVPSRGRNKDQHSCGAPAPWHLCWSLLVSGTWGWSLRKFQGSHPRVSGPPKVSHLPRSEVLLHTANDYTVLSRNPLRVLSQEVT